MSNYVCQYPVHPGEILKKEIECRHISQTVLSKQLGIPYKILNATLNCHRPLSTKSAMLFAAALDLSSKLLMEIQVEYNMQLMLQDKSFIKRLENIRKFVVSSLSPSPQC